jgi:hypothetical protein
MKKVILIITTFIYVLSLTAQNTSTEWVSLKKVANFYKIDGDDLNNNRFKRRMNSFSQQKEPAHIIPEFDYLTTSKTQKIFGFILLGAGATTLIIISKGNTSFDVLPILAIGGTLAVLGSIPLFVASGRNKRKAKTASAYLRIKEAKYFQ